MSSRAVRVRDAVIAVSAGAMMTLLVLIVTANPQQTGGTFRGGGGGRELRPDFTPLGEHGEQGTLIVLEDTSTVIAQAQQLKLASLGSLTAGIAHEINNPVNFITSNIAHVSDSHRCMQRFTLV